MNLDDYFGTKSRKTVETNKSIADRASGYSNAQQASSDPLSAIFNALIVNPGRAVVDFFGSNTARVGNLLQGKSAKKAEEEAQRFTNMIYGTDNNKEANARRLGSALDLAAAGTNAFAPGLGGAITGGALRGAGSEFTQMGENADIGRALGRGLVGGLSEGASAGLLKGAGNITNRGTGRLASALGKVTNPSTIVGNIGRGALSGATEGALQGAGNALVAGGSLEDALGSAAQGFGGGGLMGGIAGGAMGAGSRAIRRITNGRPTVEMLGEEIATPGKARNTTQRLGDSLQGAQSNLTRAEVKRLGVSPGEAIGKVSRLTGVTNLDEQALIAKQLTGGDNSIMDEIQNFNISNVKGKPIKVDTGSVSSQVESIMDEYIPQSVLSGDARRNFELALKRDVSNGSTIQTANNLKSAAEYITRMRDNASPAQAAQAKVFRNIANKLDDLSYSAVPKENVTKMFDDTVEQFRFRADEANAAGDRVTARTYSRLADELNNTPRTVQAYRSFKKPFVDISQIDRLTNYAENGAANNMGRSARGIVGSAIDMVLERPVKRAAASVGNRLSNVGGTASRPRTSANIPTALSDAARNVIGTNEGMRAASGVSEQQNALLDQDIANVLQNYLATGGNMANIQAPRQMTSQSAQNILQLAGNQNMGSYPYQPQNTLESGLNGGTIGGVTQQQVQDNMIKALMYGDTTSYTQFSKLNDLFNDQNKVSATDQVKLTDTQRKANSALSQLNQLEGMNPDLGSFAANIPVVGNIVDLFGGNEYNTQATSLATQLGYMQSGANITPQEAERVGRSYIPSATDSEAVKQQKLRNARQIIENYMMTYAQPTLESSLNGF